MAGGQGMAELAGRIERAEAEQLARTGAPGRAAARELGGGLVVWKGPGSAQSAAFGVGLAGAVDGDDVDAIEAHLAGGPARFEVAAAAHPSLLAELARRGYHLERQLLVWCRSIGPEIEPTEAEPAVERRPSAERDSAAEESIRPIVDGEEQAWAEVFARAFLGRPPGPASEKAALLAPTSARGNVCFAAFRAGAMVAVATVSAHGGVATLSGAGVLPAHRGRGLQRGLLAARLRWAASRGADLAAAATAAGTASQRNLERAGFHCAYPKAALVRDR